MKLGGAVYLPDQGCFGIVTAIQRFGRAFIRFGVKLETGELAWSNRRACCGRFCRNRWRVTPPLAPPTLPPTAARPDRPSARAPMVRHETLADPPMPALAFLLGLSPGAHLANSARHVVRALCSVLAHRSRKPEPVLISLGRDPSPPDFVPVQKFYSSVTPTPNLASTSRFTQATASGLVRKTRVSQPACSTKTCHIRASAKGKSFFAYIATM